MALLLLVLAACQKPPQAVEVHTPVAMPSGEPGLATDAEGLAYLSWLERTADGGQALKYAIYDRDKLGPPLDIEGGALMMANAADVPSLLPLADGSLAAEWLSTVGGAGAYVVFVAVKRPGVPDWSEPARPNKDATLTEHGFASLIDEGSGRVGVVWLDGRNTVDARGKPQPLGETMLMYSRLEQDGFVAEEILDRRVCDCCQTAAAATPAGLVVAYRDRAADEIRDIVVVRREGGRWSEPKAVHADAWKLSGCPVNGPALAARGNHLALAWYTAADDKPTVSLTLSDDGGASFGGSRRIDEGKPLGHVAVAWLDDQTAVVSWLETTAAGVVDLKLRRVGARDLGPPMTVAAGADTHVSGFPRLAVVGRQVLLAWTDGTKPQRVRMKAVAM